MQQSRDYLGRGANCPGVIKSVAVQVLAYNCRGTNKKTLVTFPHLKNSITGLTSLPFLPDTRALEANRNSLSAEDQRLFAELYGEHDKNLPKVSAEILLVTNITSLKQILVLLSNYSLLCFTTNPFDYTQCGDSSPLLHVLAFKFSDVLTDYTFVEWYNVLSEKSRGAFLHWALECCENVLQSCLSFASSTTNINYVLTKRFSDIPVKAHRDIEDYIDNTMSQVHQWLTSGTTVVEPGFLYKSSVHYDVVMKKEQKKRDAENNQSSGGHNQNQERHTKSPRLEGPSQDTRYRIRLPPSTPRSVGELISTTPRLECPTVPPGLPIMCLSHIKHDTVCRDPHCKRDHPPDYAAWYQPYKKAWGAQVRKDANLSWNSALVPSPLE